MSTTTTLGWVLSYDSSLQYESTSLSSLLALLLYVLAVVRCLVCCVLLVLLGGEVAPLVLPLPLLLCACWLACCAARLAADCTLLAFEEPLRNRKPTMRLQRLHKKRRSLGINNAMAKASSKAYIA